MGRGPERLRSQRYAVGEGGGEGTRTAVGRVGLIVPLSPRHCPKYSLIMNTSNSFEYAYTIARCFIKI